MSFTKANYSLILKIGFLLLSGSLVWLGFVKFKGLPYMKEMVSKGKLLESILKYLAYLSYGWLSIGLAITFLAT